MSNEETQIRVVVCRPGQSPEAVLIGTAGEEIVELVAGNLVAGTFLKPMGDDVYMYYNDTMLQDGSPINRFVQGIGQVNGTFVVSKLDRFGEDLGLTEVEAANVINLLD